MTLRELFNAERERVRMAGHGAQETTAVVAAVTDADYANECAVLPKSAFQKVDFDVMVPDDFKMFWPDETVCCLAALPFNDGGYGKAEMQLEGKWKAFTDDKSFLRMMMVMPLSKLTSGFGNAGKPAGRYYEMLPEILKKDLSEDGCSFDVRYEDSADPDNAKDRAWFLAQCTAAFSNLKKFLGK